MHMRKKIAWHVMVVAVWFVAANVAQAAKPEEFAGTWVMRLGGRNLLVLTLTPDGDGVRGIFERPVKFSLTGSTFTGVSGISRQDKVVQSHFADGVLHLTIQNANDAKDEDSYRMVVNGNRAELTF